MLRFQTILAEQNKRQSMNTQTIDNTNLYAGLSHIYGGTKGSLLAGSGVSGESKEYQTYQANVAQMGKLESEVVEAKIKLQEFKKELPAMESWMKNKQSIYEGAKLDYEKAKQLGTYKGLGISFYEKKLKEAEGEMQVWQQELKNLQSIIGGYEKTISQKEIMIQTLSKEVQGYWDLSKGAVTEKKPETKLETSVPVSMKSSTLVSELGVSDSLHGAGGQNNTSLVFGSSLSNQLEYTNYILMMRSIFDTQLNQYAASQSKVGFVTGMWNALKAENYDNPVIFLKSLEQVLNENRTKNAFAKEIAEVTNGRLSEAAAMIEKEKIYTLNLSMLLRLLVSYPDTPVIQLINNVRGHQTLPQFQQSDLELDMTDMAESLIAMRDLIIRDMPQAALETVESLVGLAEAIIADHQGVTAAIKQEFINKMIHFTAFAIVAAYDKGMALEEAKEFASEIFTPIYEQIMSPDAEVRGKAVARGMLGLYGAVLTQGLLSGTKNVILNSITDKKALYAYFDNKFDDLVAQGKLKMTSNKQKQIEEAIEQVQTTGKTQLAAKTGTTFNGFVESGPMAGKAKFRVFDELYANEIQYFKKPLEYSGPNKFSLAEVVSMKPPYLRGDLEYGFYSLDKAINDDYLRSLSPNQNEIMFVLKEDGNFVISPREKDIPGTKRMYIPHPILSSGEDVISAGLIKFDGNDIILNNSTGHFRVSLDSIQSAADIIKSKFPNFNVKIENYLT